MGRPIKITKLPEDPQTIDSRFPDIVTRVRVPGLLWDIAEKYGARHEIPQAKALLWVLQRFTYLLRDNAKILGAEFVDAIESVRKEAAIRVFDEIDHNLLHRSDRTKSGYEGVYVTGEGFRAMAPDPRTRSQIFLGFFDSAEAAAWARYQHHIKHKIPYGAFASELKRMRSSPQETEEDLIDLIVRLHDGSIEGIPDGLDDDVLMASRARVRQMERDDEARRKRADMIKMNHARSLDENGRPFPTDVDGRVITPENPRYPALYKARAEREAREAEAQALVATESSTETPES